MSTHDLDLFYETVLNLTKAAGQIIKEKTLNRDKSIEFKSSERDLVTETDIEVENLLINGLSKKFPDHKFIAEESEAKGATSVLTDAPTWIIDPIDGTMNFVHSFPHSCISIALYVKRVAEIGIVYNPSLEQLFTARKGQGAFLNGKQIRVSDTKSFSKALIMIDYIGGTPIGKIVPEIVENFVWVLQSSHATRTIGSAALSLCMIACGAVEAYYFYGLSPWDVAAGELIVRESGGLVTSTTGKPFDLFEKKILASNSQEIVDVISSKLVELEAKLKKYS